jgi:hypothetical protein
MLRAALLLALLLALAQHGRAAEDAEQGFTHLPRNPAAWPRWSQELNRVTQLHHGRNATAWSGCAEANRSTCARPWEVQHAPQAFWPRSRLARAALVTSLPDAWLPLLTKLRAGQPITVLALGSSIVEAHAGCFATASGVAAAGVSRVSGLMARDTEGGGGVRSSSGFVSFFMSALNATWPHAHHLFLNGGVGATNLQSMGGLCFDHLIPAAGLDLILFETHEPGDVALVEDQVHLNAPVDVERLYKMLLDKLPPTAAPPPLVLLSAVSPVRGMMGLRGPALMAAGTCMGQHGRVCASCNASVAAALVADVASTAVFAEAEAKLVALCRRYGWAMLSMHDMLAAGMRDGLPAALGWSECEWVNAFYGDDIHPSPAGMRVLGDALLSLLLAAQDAADEAEVEEDADGAAALPVLLPRNVPLSGAAAWPPASRSCAEADNLTPSRAEGWHYTPFEIVKGRQVWKKGWLANATGATLELPLRTRMRALPAEQAVALTVRYLTSYEHMGAAQLSCVAPSCECAPLTLQGHAGERVSVERSAMTRVSQAEACTLRMTVLPDTLSGEHKVKILGFSLAAA